MAMKKLGTLNLVVTFDFWEDLDGDVEITWVVQRRGSNSVSTNATDLADSAVNGVCETISDLVDSFIEKLDT